MSLFVVVPLTILLNLVQANSFPTFSVTSKTIPPLSKYLAVPAATKTLHLESISGTRSLASSTAAPLLPRGYFDDSGEDSWWYQTPTSSDDTSSSDSTSSGSDSSNSFTYTYSQSSNSTYCHESYEEYCRRNEIDQGDGNGEKRKKWEKWMKKNCWNWSDSNAGGGGGGSDSGRTKIVQLSLVFAIVLLSSIVMI